MKKIERIKKKTNDFLFDHFILNRILINGRQLILAVAAAALFAFGFCAFATPSATSEAPFTVVTGGVSGISQNIALFIEIVFKRQIGQNTVQAISYFALNLPIIIFGFFKVGKRFSIYTLINVAFSSLFISLFSQDNGIGQTIASNPLISNSLISRVLFAGVCTGISSGIAYRADASCGGIDVFTYYFALRKSTSVGKYGAIINAVIVSLYGILLMIKNPGDWDQGIVSILYSVGYLLIVAFVIDAINLRNKKVQISIITKNENLSHVLIANFPHGATEVRGRGVYTGEDDEVIYMIVSSYEVSKVVKLAKKVDPHSFIVVTALSQVYGNFFIKPIE